MDLLQVALVFLIMLLAVLLSVLGFQVFLILKDLRKSLDKIDLLLGNAQSVAENIQKPFKAAAELSEVVETGVQAAKALGNKLLNERKEKPNKRLFKFNSK